MLDTTRDEDKRRYPRLGSALPASLKVVSDDRVGLMPADAQIVDFSRGGTSLRLAMELFRQDVVKVEFPMPDSGLPQKVYAIVTWTQRHGAETLAGLQFSGISELAQDQIEAWVELGQRAGGRSAN